MYTFNCKGRLVVLREPLVMGILNITPDSFYSGSRMKTVDDVLFHAEQMIQDGAAIIDIGGQSTRPGSERVAADEELKRVLPAVEAIHKRFPEQLISIDTYYGKVAEAAVKTGACIVNDVSGGTLDEALLPTVAALQVPYVLMHMKDDPKVMQRNPAYQNVTLEVFDYLNFRLSELLKLGITDVIVDPGFGFGKTATHNFQLLHELAFLQQLKRPLLVGISRKATIYKTLEISAEEALNGTTVLHTIALLHGANILRVHDVKEAVQAVKLIQAYKR